MLTDMELWAEVRRRVLTSELSRRQAAKEYQLNYRTVEKIVGNVEPPGYRRVNEKEKVEGLVGFTRRYFSVPVWKVDSLEALNAELARRCEADLDRKLRGKSGSKRELLAEDRDAMLELLEQPFDARRVTQAAACGLSLVRFDSNRYSVPVAHTRRPITIVASVDTVRLVDGGNLIAMHARRWKRDQDAYDPVHYLALLEKKPGGFDHAKPLEQWGMPACFDQLRRLIEAEGSYFPHRCPRAPEDKLVDYTVRMHIVKKSYLLLFRVDDPGHTVTVIAFRHGRRLPFEELPDA